MKKKELKIQKDKEEEIAGEDWCFVCKDGGTLLVCDYKKCQKSYHPDCVEKDDSFLDNGTHWTCDWHTCFICQKSSKFRCYVCPQAVCQRCINAAEFVHVRKKKGFCNNCLKLALLVEEKKDIDSDGERVDFQDLETFEGLFMEYWEIINKKEKFTVEDLRAADVRLKMEKNYNPRADLKRRRKSIEVVEMISEDDDDDDDDDDMDDIEENKQRCKRKRSKWQASLMKSKLKSNKKEFVGWGSKSLIQFLESIGKNASKKLSQHDVCNIINGYVKEKNLFHPQKKKKVICDARLQAVLGRKTVNKHTIYDLLESHFAENMEKSEEDEVGYMSEEEDDDYLFICERERNSNTEKVSKKKEVDFNIPQICFAAIVVKNIKLVYLKRSLLQELSKQNETFERKVIGSFVKVKSGPHDCIKKSYHQLVQVTGIKKSSSSANDADILLQVSDMPNDICISMLSDDDFSEEECESLREKVKSGLLKKVTVDELEQKARSLHEDITKHWIAKELALLQILIDRANEKGWRRECFTLYECLQRRKLLQTSAEQSRLLQMAPTVIPDAADLIPISEDVKVDDKQGDEEGSPKSILVGSSEIPSDNLEGNGTSSGDGAVIKNSSNNGDGNEQAISTNTATKVTEVADEKKDEYSSCFAGANQNQTPDVEKGTKKKQEAPALQPIVCYSDDDDDDDDDDGNDKSNVANGKKGLEVPPTLVPY